MDILKWDEEQTRTLQMCEKGLNIYLGGSAGAGKSRVIQEILENFSRKNARHALTATTGIAAFNIGGVTIFSWGGIGKGEGTAEELCQKIQMAHRDAKRKRQAKITALERWRRTSLIIIDEISMLHPEIFEKLDQIARFLRGEPHKPWGGIHLVLSGDFQQLGPILHAKDPAIIELRAIEGALQGTSQHLQLFTKNHMAFCSHIRVLILHYMGPNADELGSTYLFYRRAWNEAIPRNQHILLQGNYRQKTDPIFYAFLQRLRINTLTAMDHAWLQAKYQYYLDHFDSTYYSSDGLNGQKLIPPLLTALNSKVAQENQKHFDRLTTPVMIFVAIKLHHLERACVAIERSSSLLAKKEMETLTTNLLAPEQLELRIGAQVMLVTNLDVERGLINGARGRVVAFAQGRMISTGEFGNKRQKIAVQDEKEEATDPAILQVHVDFGAPHGIVPIGRSQWQRGVTEYQRQLTDQRQTDYVTYSQFPFILSYALTIHKAQGLTLQEMRADLQDIWIPGQAYVLLSRVSTSIGLWIVGYNAKAILSDPRVAQFYRGLQEQQNSMKKSVSLD